MRNIFLLSRKKMLVTGVSCVLLGLGLIGIKRLDIVHLITPQKKFIRHFVYAHGWVESVNTTKIVSKRSGKLTQLSADAGDLVNNGQVLAVIENYMTQKDFEQIEAKRNYLLKKVESKEKLRVTSTVSELDYLEIYSQLLQVNADFERSQEHLKAQTVQADASGLILEKYKELGESVVENEPLFLFAPDGKRRVVAQIDSEDILRVEPGQTAFLISEASHMRVIETTVEKVLPLGDQKSRTFKVYITIPDDVVLPYGLSVKVNILVRENRDALVLPATAVFNQKVQIYKSPTHIYERQIDSMVSSHDVIEVCSGLSAQEKVVVPFRSDLESNKVYIPRSGGAR